MEGNKITYHQQVSFCGKARCRRCREGIGHGPYWYAYQTVNGRTVRTYIGKDAPAEVLAAQADTSSTSSREFANTLLRLYVLGQFRLEQRSDISTPSSPTPSDAGSPQTRGRAQAQVTSSSPTSQPAVSSQAAAAAAARKAARAAAIAPAASVQWEVVTDASLQHQRVRSLLSCLVSSPGRKLAREQVMYTLWPELDMDTASHRLDRAVHSLRQAFEPGRGQRATSRLLLTEHSTLTLADQPQFWVDADAFEQLITRARAVQESDPGKAEQLLEEAMQLYQGDFIPDEDAIEWVKSRRESLRRAWISGLLELADLRIAREAMPAAIDILDRLLTADPANEAAVQRLITLLAQMGRRPEAIQAYQRFAMVLKQDYKIAPLPETRTLYENVLHGRAVLTPSAAHKASGGAPAVKKSEDANGSRPSSRGSNGVAPASGPASSGESYSSASMPAVLPSHMYIGRTQQSPLVGREEEITRLHQLLDITQQTRGLKLAGQRKSALLTPMDINTPRRQQCVMLMGDVGMGKTRLAEEAAREAKRRNWAVAWSRAYTQESSVPYRLWTETLRKAMSQGLWQRQEVTKRPLIYQPLRALLPELADLLPSMPQQMPPPPEQEQLRLWESTRALLSTISENTTLLIVLDDLQWADASSCELLTYLVRQMRGMPVLFLCTCRDTELPNNHPLRGLLTDLQREQAVEQIPVRPLSEEEIGQLISHLPEPVVKSVSTRASGNPFFAEELARGITTSAIDVTFDPANPNQLPDTIQAVLDLRLARISPECQRLLERGAVLGGAFLFDTIRDMASGGALADEDLILDLLEESLQAGMLTEEGSGMRITYHFWHPLLLTYLYERLSAARRASLHRKAAQVLQTLYATNEAEGAAEITTHLVRGGATPALTAHFAELAADRAYSLSAYPDAEKYYRLALEHMGALSAAASQEERLHHAYILECLGECARVQGNYQEARNLYEQILDMSGKYHIYSSPGDDLQREKQIHALLWIEIGRSWYDTNDHIKAQQCYGQGEQILHETGMVKGPIWANLRLQQGYANWRSGNFVESQHDALDALSLFEELLQEKTHSSQKFSQLTKTQRALEGDPVNLGRTHRLLAAIAAASGQNAKALKHLNVALEIFERYDHKQEIATICGSLGDLYLRTSEYTLAQNILLKSIEIAENIGDIPAICVGYGNLGILFTRLGDLKEAEKHYRLALSLAEQINDVVYISLWYSYLAPVLQDQGKISDAVISVTKALKQGRAINFSLCIGLALIALGHLRIIQAQMTEDWGNGHLETKERSASKFEKNKYLNRAHTSLKHALAYEGLEAETRIDGQLALAETALLSGNLEVAYQQALHTLKEAQECNLVWLVASCQRMLGRILAAQKSFKNATIYFNQALALFKDIGMDLEHARTLYTYSNRLLTFPDNVANREEILAYLQEARQVFQNCNAVLDLQNVEHTLRLLSAQVISFATPPRKQDKRTH